MSDNPFESPLAEPEGPDPATDEMLVGGEQEVYVEGDCLVVRSGTILPLRCVKTNAPASPKNQIRKEMYWAPSWIALLILANVVILLIVYLAVRKKCVLVYSEDPQLRSARHRRVLAVSLVAVAITLGLILSIAYEAFALTGFAVLGLLGALIALLIVGRGPIRPVKHKEGYFWIRGFSREYLQECLLAASA
ncbi:hypothetical protein NG895_26050 [Aeoliella sp. ICT_H6.2]|uniref:Uncharacterized protein n=1 Tax=Aeoliella straminimaris TaxID=2954799 RepID=A0A9X2JIR3_9BACT|nr:hypothetical protein [Aeoliella straminimaris]MCO6047380.1 hypothetical protein [Aeoliella straminimaris]